MITIVHPSRNRAEQAFKTYSEWKEKSLNDFEYYISIEPDQVEEYVKYFDKKNIIVNENKTAIDAVNNAVNKLELFDILIVISDDFFPPNNWDSLIEQAVEGKSDFVLKTFDGLQKWIVTLPIMDKVYYDRFGYVYYPEYKHLFCDTELTTVAQYLGKLIIRNDIVFEHKNINDKQHSNTNATWKQGEKLYMDRYRHDFGVDKTYDITDFDHKKWIRSRT